MLKMKKKPVSWKANTMSKADRLTLIKSNLMGMLNHIMAHLKCPEALIKTINKENRLFLSLEKKKQTNKQIESNRLGQSLSTKECWVLGIRKSEHFNNAFPTKLGWKLTDDHNRWVQIARQKYSRQETFFETKIKQNTCLPKLGWKARTDDHSWLVQIVRKKNTEDNGNKS